MLPKINLEHLELLRPWGLRSSSMEAPGLHATNFKFNTQCYNDAIGLTSRCNRRSVVDKLFFKMKFQDCFISWC